MAVLLLAAGLQSASAYPSYDDGAGVGCVACHPGFQGGNGALHTQHRVAFGVTTCNLCHPNGGGTTPVLTYSSGPGGGLGCAGCHGNDYGETSPNSGQPKATGYGLRAYHASQGVTVCASCHQPGALGHQNPFPPLFTEDVPPPYFNPAYSNLTNPCDSAEEDLATDVDTLGLDNDGDGARDYPNDSDCAMPTTTTSTTLPPNVTSTGITGLKLILVDKYVASSKAKAVVVSKDTTSGAIHKGVQASPPDLSGTVEIFDKNNPSNAAVYDLAAANWLVNKPTVAKYVLKTAAPGGSGVKVAVVKPNLLLKIVGKSLGDGDAATGDQNASDLDAGALGVGDQLRVRVTILNGSDASTHIMCSDFTVEIAASVAGGTGHKIISKNSTAPGSCT
ncbi:MAG TPA: hypothetical protein VNO26_15295 [Candidatus Limnocylindria bacterium]|nr:hypothetical protein [Candidatus Limnocylindria bacterium]